MSVHAEFGRSPAAELSDRPEETLIIDCADRAEEPPALKKRKSGVLTKPNDSAAKGAIHPSGPKFINSWLWKHYKLSPRSDCDKFREYLEYLSRGGYAIPHRTKTTEIEDAAVIEVEKKDYNVCETCIVSSIDADGATAHTGESYVAVTGHWIDRVPQTGQNLQLARCSWKLLSAVLAVSVNNESHTAENIATLLKECSEVPDHATRAFIQLFRDITNAIRNSSQRLEHLKRLQKEKIKADKDIMEIINEGVREWDELPSEVYECFLSLKTGFKTRFNPSSFLLTDAALVHSGHKSLSWLEPTRREEAIQQFKDELLIVAGIEGHPDPSNSPSSLDIQEDAVPNQSALDAFFDFDCKYIVIGNSISLDETSAESAQSITSVLQVDQTFPRQDLSQTQPALAQKSELGRKR
eukprot:Em0024g60a